MTIGAPERAYAFPGSLSLVLPAHNEAANLGPVVERALEVLPRYAADFEIIVVDDGSRDATPRIADALAAADDRVRAIHHPRNRGYGAALTWRATAVEPRLPALLQSSELGQSVYERLGYTVVTRLGLWERARPNRL